MKIRIPFLLLIVTFIILSLEAQSQKTENNFNVGFMVGGNLGDSPKTLVNLNIGHEWKPYSFLGAELNASYGSLVYSNDWEEIDLQSNAYNKRYNYERLSCNYETIHAKINGYLTIFYTDDDKPMGFLFASITAGVAAIQTKGELETSEDKKLKTSSHHNPHFYTGLEIGLGARLSDSFRIKLSIGGSTIKFDDTAEKMNQENKDFPLQFKSNFLEPAIRASITYMLKYRKEK